MQSITRGRIKLFECLALNHRILGLVKPLFKMSEYLEVDGDIFYLRVCLTKYCFIDN